MHHAHSQNHAHNQNYTHNQKACAHSASKIMITTKIMYMHAHNRNHERSQNNKCGIGLQKIGSCDYSNHVCNQPKSFTSQNYAHSQIHAHKQNCTHKQNYTHNQKTCSQTASKIMITTKIM